MKNTNSRLWEADVAEGVSVVVVWDDWCRSCGPLKDLLVEIEPLYPDVKFFSAKLDDNYKHAYKLGVQTLPTLFFYINGKLMDEAEGARGRTDLVQRIEHWRAIAEKMALYAPIRV